MEQSGDISLRPYSSDDKWVLERTLGDPVQMVHLNGPESEERLKRRHELFLTMSSDQSAGCMYTITVGAGSSPAGNVGFWETEWEGENGWETGWFVLPEFQRKGVATAATKLLIEHVAQLSRRFMFAFPSVGNTPSNSICRKLGFVLMGENESEYPPKSGLKLRHNVWRLDLRKNE